MPKVIINLRHTSNIQPFLPFLYIPYKKDNAKG
ncbi:unknown [Bacteroides fragilis CAG:558]|nr:unknown [Bacteroides fragilis CAG:558]